MSILFRIHTSKWLIFSVSFSKGPFYNQLAEGWQFGLYGPQRIKGIETFRGISWRHVTKNLLDEALKK